MAARRVSLGYLVSSMLLSVGAAVATFQLKYAVRDVEDELGDVQAQIAQERWAICRSARADLEYLTRPDRMVMQAASSAWCRRAAAVWPTAGQLPDWDELQWAQRSDRWHMLPSGAESSFARKPSPSWPISGGAGLMASFRHVPNRSRPRVALTKGRAPAAGRRPPFRASPSAASACA